MRIQTVHVLVIWLMMEMQTVLAQVPQLMMETQIVHVLATWSMMEIQTVHVLLSISDLYSTPLYLGAHGDEQPRHGGVGELGVLHSDTLGTEIGNISKYFSKYF